MKLDDRDRITLAEALVHAITMLSALPEQNIPTSDIADMKRLLDDLSIPSGDLAHFQNHALESLRALMGKRR